MSDQNDLRPEPEPYDAPETEPLKEIVFSNPSRDGRGRLANYGVIAISVIAILYGIYMARSVLNPILIAAFFAVILYPFYSFLRKRFTSVGALVLITGAVLLFGAVLMMVLTTQLSQFSKKFPGYWNSFSEFVIDSNDALMKRNIQLKEMFDFIPFLEKNDAPDDVSAPEAQTPLLTDDSESVPAESADAEGADAETADPPPSATGDGTDLLSAVTGIDLIDDNDILPPANFKETPEKVILVSLKVLYRYIIEGISKLMSFVSLIFLVVLLLIFMLIEVAYLPEKVKLAIGDTENERVRTTLGLILRYMWIKTLVSMLVAFLIMVLLLAMKIEYWALWCLLAFFLNFIPNIGSVVAAIPPIIVAFADRGFWPGVIVMAGYLVANIAVGYIVEPKLLGDGLGISALVVMLSLVICGALLGPVGMFLSPLLAVICKIILSQFDETRWIAVLMANGVPSPGKDETLDTTPAETR